VHLFLVFRFNFITPIQLDCFLIQLFRGNRQPVTGGYLVSYEYFLGPNSKIIYKFILKQTHFSLL